MKMYIIMLDVADSEEYEAVSSHGINGKPIYAVTNKKDFYEKFIETRDMTKFIVKKISIESEEEYMKIIEDKDLTQCELTKSSFPTTIEYNNYYTIGYVNVICTIAESDGVEYDYSEYVVENIQNVIDGIYDVVYKADRSKLDSDAYTIKKYLNMFNKEIKKSLEYLGFQELIEDTMYQLDAYDSSEVELGEDKLRIYCKKYANTYKKGFKE